MFARIKDLESSKAGLMQPGWKEGVEQVGRETSFNPRLASVEDSPEKAGWQVRYCPSSPPGRVFLAVVAGGQPFF